SNRLAEQLRDIAGAQQEAGQVVGRIREILEQNASADLTLAAVQEIQEKTDSVAAALSGIQEGVRKSQTALETIGESNRQVVQSFETYHAAAREETERIRARTAQEHNSRGVLLDYRCAPEAGV